MRTSTVLTIALLLGISTASIAHAQSGSSRNHGRVTPDEAQNLVDWLYLLLGDAVQTEDSKRQRRARSKRDGLAEKDRTRRRRPTIPDPFTDDASAYGGD